VTQPKVPPNAGTAASRASLEQEVRRLGEALSASCGEVVARTGTRTAEAGLDLDVGMRKNFEEISTLSTTAVANWISGGSPEDGRQTSRRVFETYGHIAAQRVVPLHEVIKRCLRWRDAIIEVLEDQAKQLGVSAQALERATAMAQKTLDVTNVRLGECFEGERRKMDEELAFRATHDALTGLPNRTLILDRAEQALARARRNQMPVAALFIDIDNFKTINDTLGHEAGDALLRHLAVRLDGIVRATDALGRLGGDEFVVIAEDLSLEAGPGLVAERLLETLRQPLRLDGACNTQITVTASIGIAMGLRDSAEELLRDADIAMYRAKQGGRNCFVVFEADMHRAIRDRMELEMDLHEALTNREYFLVYQPTFDLREMRPTGVEALLRWRHPRRGVVQPNDFIPMLEETGLIVAAGRWVLEEACLQAAAWKSAGQPVRMAVNVSARQLDADDFIRHVNDALEVSGLEPAWLTLEITETALMRNANATAQRLIALKQLGVRVAIDDFGTGYSSLGHLQRFPVDALKIDRSFVARLTRNPESEALIRTLVQLGKALALETLAEGIEQRGELDLLLAENCDSGQGFLLARPLEVDAAEAFLRDPQLAATAAGAVKA
jgi:diguanylate cyclase (GGDEF)-like protein